MKCRYLLCAAAAMLLLCGCNERPPSTRVSVNVGSDVKSKAPAGTEQIVAFRGDGDEVAVRSLDDPDNAYRDDYDDFDRWAYQNVQSDWDHDDVVWRDGHWVYPGHDDWRVVPLRVDHDGFMVPLERYVTYGPVTPALYYDDDYHYVYAAGPRDIDAFSYYDRLSAVRYADDLDTLPEWLLALSADRVVMMPEREYVVLAGDDWRRYDYSGRVVSSVPSSSYWQSMYWPDLSDVVATALGRNLSVIDDDGFLLFEDGAGSIVEAYDYFGSPVRLTSLARPQPVLLTSLDFDNVRLISEAQSGVLTEALVRSSSFAFDDGPGKSRSDRGYNPPGGGIGREASDKDKDKAKDKSRSKAHNGGTKGKDKARSKSSGGSGKDKSKSSGGSGKVKDKSDKGRSKEGKAKSSSGSGKVKSKSAGGSGKGKAKDGSSGGSGSKTGDKQKQGGGKGNDGKGGGKKKGK